METDHNVYLAQNEVAKQKIGVSKYVHVNGYKVHTLLTAVCRSQLKQHANLQWLHFNT